MDKNSPWFFKVLDNVGIRPFDFCAARVRTCFALLAVSQTNFWQVLDAVRLDLCH